ncbi:MAG: caspase family protein [Prevotella sp.]|nr:caspase family protein [Prevotella sp.]
MKRGVIITIFLIVAYISKSYAQTITVCGYVLNDDLEPIPHAIIEVADSYIMVESNSAGFYSVILPNGRQKFKVSAVGYKPLNINVNNFSLLDVILVPSNIKKIRSEYVAIPSDTPNEADTTLLADLAYIHYEKYRYEEALALWQEGEKMGSAKCRYNVGIMHLYGHGVEPDLHKAYSCIQIAALQGEDFAQLAIGDSYCSGLFTNCDTTMAVYWYGRAAAQGNLEAKQKLDSLSGYKREALGNKKCLAFILGNSNYWKGNVLITVKNDVELLAEHLKAIGIDTQLCMNLTKPEMYDSIDAFAKAACNYDFALFYYSGMSAQDRGSNYLIPVGKMKQTSKTGILADCVGVDYLFKCFSDNGIDSKIVILDACRDNSSVFGTDENSPHLGLSPSSLNPYGSFVAYATQPNAIVVDSDNKDNSVFLRALVKALTIPNLQIFEVFELVKLLVAYETDNHQVPVYMNNLKDRFVLNPCH